MSKSKAGRLADQGEGAGTKFSLYPTDKYSLYSTDTEERIISVDQGLERCAAMLRSLEEKETAVGYGYGVPQGVAWKPDPGEKPGTRKVRRGHKEDCKKLLKNSEVRKPRSGGGGGGASAAVATKQLEPGQSAQGHTHHHHTRPTACSTPDSKHGGGGGVGEGQGRSKSKPLGPRDMKANSTPPPSVPVGMAGEERELAHCMFSGSAEDLPFNPLLPSLRNVKPHRRLKTETGKVPPSLGSLQGGGGSGGSGKLLAAAGTQGRGHRTRSATTVPPERSQQPGQGRAPVSKTTPTTSNHHLPAPPPPPPPPPFHPYFHPYPYPYLAPYPFAYYPPQFLPPAPEWGQEEAMGHAPRVPFRQPPTQAEALDLATLHHRHPYYLRGYPLDCHPYYLELWKHHEQPTRDQVNPRVPPTAERTTPITGIEVGWGRSGERARGEKEEGKGGENGFAPMPPGGVGGHQHQVLDVESLDILLCELLNSCEEQVQRVRAECGSLLVGGKLDEVRGALRQCRQQLHQQCRRLAVVQREAKGTETTPPDLVDQLRQLEKEREGLMERLKESCAAYSEVKRTLGGLERAKEEQARELEVKKLELLKLQSKLDSVTTDFGQTVSSLKTTKEELDKVRQFNQVSSNLETKLKDKIVALQQRVHSLTESSKVLGRERGQLAEQLAQARQGLEVGKEDQQMLKVTLSEKTTQLLRAEDQLLGLRQCLAHFVSEVSRTANSDGVRMSGSSVYSVSAGAVNQLKDLANHGNVERFLAGYSEGTNKSKSFGFKDTSPQSVSSAATVTGDEGMAPFPVAGEVSSQINVITPLLSARSSPAASIGSNVPTRVPTRDGGGGSSSSISSSQSQQVLQESGKIRARGQCMGISGPTQSSETRPTVATTANSVATTANSAGQYGYQLYPLNPTSSRSSLASEVRSSVTTASEVDFRNNLASLDADIARLQMQFKVAMQGQR